VWGVVGLAVAAGAFLALRSVRHRSGGEKQTAAEHEQNVAKYHERYTAAHVDLYRHLADGDAPTTRRLSASDD
jgi:hypothetical protein